MEKAKKTDIGLVQLLAIICLISVIHVGYSQADELRVPGVYPTIADAVEAAVNGDEIVLAARSGGYTAAGNINIEISGLAITIRPEGPDNAAPVTIDCMGSSQSYVRAFNLANGASLTLKRLIIKNGYNTLGGAILVNNSSIVIEDSTFSSCYSVSTGGAISVSGASSTVMISNCDFDINQAEFSGGAISVSGNIPVSISGCSFTDNISSDNDLGGDGGALAIEDNTEGVNIDRCSFIGNYAGNFGGAIYGDTLSGLTISSSLMAGNYADSHGGGIYLGNSPFSSGTENNKIINCTVTENRSNSQGGGVKLSNSELLLANSIIYNNVVGEDQYGYQGQYSEMAITGENSLLLYVHNIIQGGLESSFNNEYVYLQLGALAENRGGNMDTDPEFAQAGCWQEELFQSGNYQITADSQCFNAGKNELSDGLSYNLAGNDRIINKFVDIGCYEVSEVPSGLDITGEAAAIIKFPEAILPGDKGKVALTLRNDGDMPLTGEMGVKLYYSEDEYVSQDDTLLYTTPRALRLKFPAADNKTVRKYSYSYTVPSDIAAGSYYLLAQLDYEDTLAEVDESINSNVLNAGAQEIHWKFGNFNGRNNARLILIDKNGVLNQYSLKDGQGEIAEDRSTINLIGNSPATTLTVASKTRGATTVLGNINCEGSFNLNAKKCDLAGDINVSGIMTKIMLGNISASSINIAGSSDNPRTTLSFMASNIINTALLCPELPINSIKVSSWLDDGSEVSQITAPWLKTLSCKGDFEADINLSGQNAAGQMALTSASVSGEIKNCTWRIAGHAKRIMARALSEANLLIGVKDEITYPTGSEYDFEEQFSLGLTVKGSGVCLTNSVIMSYTVTSLSCKGIGDGISILEYFDSPRQLKLPEYLIVPLPE
ncbi:MAG: hypothetical protein JW745_00825 [Sedimentisphaerales bacterium]|nr:hypothetical protein [Sedimentisphaerales bacterium]MBN2842629.1 hypothetical protein [Sedimentisphaerales bacterium]